MTEPLKPMCPICTPKKCCICSNEAEQCVEQPNHPGPSADAKRIKELEAEVKRLRAELGEARDWEFWDRVRDQRDELLEQKKTMLPRLAQLENAIAWETSCLNCSKLLDASYAAEAELERAKPVLDAARRLADEEPSQASMVVRPDVQDAVLAVVAAVRDFDRCPSCGTGGCARHTKAVAE